jgi:signal transduction histidine kinase
MHLTHIFVYFFSLMLVTNQHKRPDLDHAHKDEIMVDRVFVNSSDSYINSVEISSNPAIYWQALNAPRFAKPYDKKHYWIKMRVKIPEKASYFVMNDYTMLEKLELYSIDENENITFHGFQGMESERNEIVYVFPVYKLQLNKGFYEIYLYQFKRFSTATQNIQIVNESDFSSFIYNYQFKNGLIYSIFIFLFFQGLITSWLFKSKKYLIYCAYLLCLFLIFTIAEGGYKHFIPIDWHKGFYFLIYYGIAGSFLCLFLLFFALIPTNAPQPTLSKLIHLFWVAIVVLLGINHYGFLFQPDFPLFIFKISNLLLAILPLSLCVLALYYYKKFKFKQALWMLLVFGWTLFFVLTFSLLPFMGIKFSLFVQFKWIIVFESIAVLVVLYTDLYWVAEEKRKLEQRIKEEKYEAALNYTNGILEERQRIATQLHDDVALNVNLLYKKIEYNIENATVPTFNDLSQLEEIREKIRRAAHSIHPLILDHLNIKEAIEYEIQKIEDSFNSFIIFPNIQVNTLHDQKTEELFYLTFLEIIQNAIKYSNATEIKVSLFEKDELALLHIEENGIGFDPEQVSKNSFGLQYIQKRANAMGGSFEIRILKGGLLHVFSLPKKNKV